MAKTSQEIIDMLKKFEIEVGEVDKMEMASASSTDLTVLIFSWSLDDILNKDLFKKKVGKIPETFSSVEHYLNSFINPLIEETHADLLSGIKAMSQKTTCEILSLEEPRGYYRDHRNTMHEVTFEGDVRSRNKDIYKPQSGDVILLSNVRPAQIDLNYFRRSPRSFVLAMVTKGVRDKIRTSKPISEQHRRRPIYAIYLMNATTNIRIWEALKRKTTSSNMNIIKEVLNANSTVDINCDEGCPREIDCAFIKDMDLDLDSFNLNESQTDAVLSSIAASTCNHKNTIKLIWGPPGTGKTKTAAILLWALLRIKCRTLTCAPTNTAVVEVASCLVKLVKESLGHERYGLGDVVLFGNAGRLSIDDHEELSDVFLDYRIKELKKCSSEWKPCLDSMIAFLRDPRPEYRLYLANIKKRKEEMEKGKDQKDEEERKQRQGNEMDRFQTGWKLCQDWNVPSLRDPRPTSHLSYSNTEKREEEMEKDKDQKDKEGKNPRQESEEDHIQKRKNKDEIEDGTLTKLEFYRKQFSLKKEGLKLCIRSLCTNLPTSFISIGVLEHMKRASDSLEHLGTVLGTDVGSPKLSDLSCKGIVECHNILISLRKEFFVPDFGDTNSIKEFCLQNACLIFCTAASSSTLQTDEMKSIEMLVVDEAAQLKESESVIPLLLPGIRHAILVGDEFQLPALIKSQICADADFGRSMFERLVLLGHSKHLLNVQYRMHPSISLFPNNEFYNNQISDASNVTGSTYRRHLLQGEIFGPYSFINVAYGKEVSVDGHSPINPVESAVVSEIVAKLYAASVATNQKVSVGVISPYNGQVFELQKKLGGRYETHSNFSLSVRSVDGFQGGEEDVIIISTVRSNDDGNVGFIEKHQRTNVALTRARHCLWIVGNGQTLVDSDTIWKKLVLDSKARGLFFNADKDDRLDERILDVMAENLSNINSLHFRGARWKVYFVDSFQKSLEGTKQVGTQKEVISLLKKLSNGWRDPAQNHENLNILNGPSSQLLKHSMIKGGQLYLLWSVEVLKENSKYIQVLKFWDILQLTGIPGLARFLNFKFRNYTMDDIYRCNFKLLEGELEVPMIWEISPDVHLSSQLASVSLGKDTDCHSASTSY